MFSPAFLIGVIVVYVAALFALAMLAERRAAAGKPWVSHPVVHALALGVFCTTWTYYGSVGKASTDGLLFVTVYLGPTAAVLLGSPLMRRIVRLKNTHRITSLADFISARYGKSQIVAALVTILLTAGIVPYLALQLKAVTGTFTLLTRRAGEASGEAGIISPIVVALLIGFTVVFGIRRLDPTERHPGMVVSLAAESVVKLVGFLVAGTFVVDLCFGGLRGFAALMNEGLPRPLGFMGRASGEQLLTWGTYLVLSMSAFAFLPRQFHVGVIENPDDRNVRTAKWLTPLYMLLINVFVVPIAVGGLVQAPPGSNADEFVLSLPMQAGARAISLLVFIGGFSAAIGMIMVETMTMATMISNHLMLPIIEWAAGLRFLRRYLLYLRWAAAAGFILASYAFEVGVGKSHMLVSMGILSFAAVLQLAPSILGGLLWRDASKAGAMLGIAAGFITWFHTLIMPTFVKSGWMSQRILDEGPFGISFLRPEAMLGLEGLPPLVHGVLWTMILNIGLYVAGSVLFETSDEERRLREQFLGGRIGGLDQADHGTATIDASAKLRGIEGLLSAYFPASEAEAITKRAVHEASVEGKPLLTVVELADLLGRIERTLAGVIGAPAAHAAMSKSDQITAKESRRLAAVYGRILADLRVSPSELRRRIDYQKEREALLTQQAAELEQRVADRTGELREANAKLSGEIAEREKAQAKLIEVHEELVETAHRAGKAEIATNVLHNVGNVLNSVNVSVGVCRKLVSESRLPGLARAVAMLEEHRADIGTFLSADPKGRQIPVYLAKLGEHLSEERATLGEELDLVQRNVEHIKTIVALQQGFAAAGPLTEVVSIQGLVEDAIRINALSFERHNIRIVREYEDVPPLPLEKHKVLQILVNLLSNAKHALAGATGEPVVTIRIARGEGDRVRLELQDNGVGIRPENLTRIFQHGFTTRKEGHGFGLHSSALFATEMGGALTAHSAGEGEGATFVLELPVGTARARPEPT